MNQCRNAAGGPGQEPARQEEQNKTFYFSSLFDFGFNVCEEVSFLAFISLFVVFLKKKKTRLIKGFILLRAENSTSLIYFSKVLKLKAVCWSIYCGLKVVTLDII